MVGGSSPQLNAPELRHSKQVGGVAERDVKRRGSEGAVVGTLNGHGREGRHRAKQNLRCQVPGPIG